MSLVRLLTAGRSLVGGNHSGLRYRMTDPKAMPKFNSPRNPFRPKAGVEVLTEEAPPAGSVQGPAPVAPAPVETVGSPATAAPVQAQKVPSLLARWQARIRGWFSRPGGGQPKPAIPRFEKSPIQTELSLDRIRVVRNDLSDADLEIVPARSATKPNRKARAQQPVQPALGLEGGNSEMESGKAPEAIPAVSERAEQLLTTGRS